MPVVQAEVISTSLVHPVTSLKAGRPSESGWRGGNE